MFITMTFLLIYVIFKNFSKKLIVLLSLEGLMIMSIFSLELLMFSKFFSMMLLLVFSIFMVLDSVFGVTLLISSSRSVGHEFKLSI